MVPPGWLRAISSAASVASAPPRECPAAGKKQQQQQQQPCRLLGTVRELEQAAAHRTLAADHHLLSWSRTCDPEAQGPRRRRHQLRHPGHHTQIEAILPPGGVEAGMHLRLRYSAPSREGPLGGRNRGERQGQRDGLTVRAHRSVQLSSSAPPCLHDAALDAAEGEVGRLPGLEVRLHVCQARGPPAAARGWCQQQQNGGRQQQQTAPHWLLGRGGATASQQTLGGLIQPASQPGTTSRWLPLSQHPATHHLSPNQPPAPSPESQHHLPLAPPQPAVGVRGLLTQMLVALEAKQSQRHFSPHRPGVPVPPHTMALALRGG